ncbi:hypothetical protein [Mycolicibacterium phlei]|uniref:hypothetical protein n=1 Tax=Mycolicibacterium phlei TaxID=1771 RepID=UPI000311591B|nr:hypothetical protein [Mycolicibacterium phlei]MBF4194656.1 hypothetical protein [Mycolicibacterium phlei]
MDNHGTRSRYVQGCTDGPDGRACEACRKANNDYLKARRQKKNAEKYGGKVAVLKPQAPAVPEPEIGPNEAATLEELAKLPNADARPGLRQVALTLARLLDSPLAIAQHPQAAGRYTEIMRELRKGAEKKGRLAAVRQMASPKVATG